MGLERFRKHDLYSNFICNPRRNLSEGKYAYRQRKQIAFFMCALQSWFSVLTVTGTLYVNFETKTSKTIYKFDIINYNVQIIENSTQSDAIMD